jgi:hypothetical protein
MQDTRYKIQGFKIQGFKIQDSRFKIQDSRIQGFKDSRFKDSRFNAPMDLHPLPLPRHQQPNPGQILSERCCLCQLSIIHHEEPVAQG